jgi:hypothetical protein
MFNIKVCWYKVGAKILDIKLFKHFENILNCQPGF